MQDVDDAVLKLVEEAEVDGRVTVGVYPCADVLERLVYSLFFIGRALV